MKRSDFIRKWLGYPHQEYTQAGIDEMREDLDSVIEWTVKNCNLQNVSKAKRTFCPNCKAGAYYIWQYSPKYTCCFCGTTWAK